MLAASMVAGALLVLLLPAGTTPEQATASIPAAAVEVD
jgi:hypothetical protein